MTWDFATEPEFEAKLEWMRAFVRENVWPGRTALIVFTSWTQSPTAYRYDGELHDKRKSTEDDDDEENTPKRRESEEKSSKKPGRKPGIAKVRAAAPVRSCHVRATGSAVAGRERRREETR